MTGPHLWTCLFDTCLSQQQPYADLPPFRPKSTNLNSATILRARPLTDEVVPLAGLHKTNYDCLPVPKGSWLEKSCDIGGEVAAERSIPSCSLAGSPNADLLRLSTAASRSRLPPLLVTGQEDLYAYIIAIICQHIS